MRLRLEGLEKKTEASDFWQDRASAEKIYQEIKSAKSLLEPWEALRKDFDEFSELVQLAVEEADMSMEGEIRESFRSITESYQQLCLRQMLSDKHDEASCFLTIHSGAGGTEACDWVAMLYRMYSRWAERRGFATTMLSLLEAEGGIKSVTLQVDGEYAYGYLKAENGVHRLVRISPFDSNKRRHTSFASVFTSPVIDEEIEIKIAPEDIRVDTYRATGAGGQHVNKTDSAVRITHIPTAIVVQCQNERSQYQNKTMAMKVLKSRLYEHYREKQEEERIKLENEKKEISWGNQIRSYTFQPYTLVKDHRTNLEIGNIQAVMDGGIDVFIDEYLKKSVTAAK